MCLFANFVFFMKCLLKLFSLYFVKCNWVFKIIYVILSIWVIYQMRFVAFYSDFQLISHVVLSFSFSFKSFLISPLSSLYCLLNYLEYLIYLPSVWEFSRNLLLIDIQFNSTVVGTHVFYLPYYFNVWSDLVNVSWTIKICIFSTAVWWIIPKCHFGKTDWKFHSNHLYPYSF